MKWLKVWKIGKAVVTILGESGVKIKGVPVATIEKTVEELLTTKKTVADLKD